MPKISAPTVAAHREAQRAALVRAAAELVRESGIATVNPRTVSEKAGMARSSFYDYFPSRDDLLVAVAIEAFDRWNRGISEALAKVDPGLPRLRALVDATMRMTAAGDHDLAGPLQQADLSPSKFDDLMVMHDALMRPTGDVVAELGLPHRWVYLVQGVLNSGVQLIEHGADLEQTVDDAYALLTAGLPHA